MIGLIDRAKQFKNGTKILTEWLGQGANTVDHRTAQRRADVCIQCPMNGRDSLITSTVADAIKQQLEIKAKMNLRVTGEKSLHTCSACGCVNRLKIWLPLQNILPTPEEMPSFSETCWLRTESKNT